MPIGSNLSAVKNNARVTSEAFPLAEASKDFFQSLWFVNSIAGLTVEN
jgi:hypothetical protein